MQSNLSVFPEHLAKACRLRKVKHDPFCAAAVDLHFAGGEHSTFTGSLKLRTSST